MEIDRWKKGAFFLSMIGCIQFVIMTFIAMLTYSGGTRINPNSTGYSFFQNFFSDLGRTISYSGEINMISFLVFLFSVSFTGVSFMAFFIVIPSFFQKTDIERRLSFAVSITGISSSVMFIGIAFTPDNVFSEMHDFFVFSAFSLAFIASILLAYLTYYNENFSFVFSLGYITFIVLILVYGIIGLIFFDIYTMEGMFIRVTTQKIVVYYLMTCFFIQSYGNFKKYSSIFRNE
ncbi:MAG: hypothetical protein ACFFAU_06950 [Candidatus Hodarchaeota archaeon]